MCGISGIAVFQPFEGNILAEARSMNHAIRHRGPDGEGFLIVDNNQHPVPVYTDETPDDNSSAGYAWSPVKHIASITESPKIILGHRRLSIIDLSPAGHQPQCNTDRKIWITYNGEIYNYIELRQELISYGFQFRTETDTEVIIAAYQKWGKDCVEHFNGMWAFVIWDAANQELFCSRDRFGVKPFYYYSNRNFFAFASEQKSLVANSLIPKSINHAAVADYFIAGEIELQAESFFKDILELFPGCSMSVSLRDGTIKRWQWYNLQERTAVPKSDYSVEDIRTLLIDAVRIRMRSDVPVGSCLSGGIDSSAIAGIIGKLIKDQEQFNIGDQLKLFTAAFDEAEIDERKWAGEVVNQTGADWKIVVPRPEELRNDIEQLIFSQDVPIWSTSTYAQHRTMRLAKENGIRVVLDGQGGDELFAGYKPYLIPFWNELFRQLKWGRLMKEMNAVSFNPASYWFREHLKQNIIPALSPAMRMNIENRYFRDLDYIDVNLRNQFLQNIRSKRRASGLNGALLHEFTYSRLKGYLKCEDRASMWHSVESRTPFADDHRLIEYVFSIPGDEKIRNGNSKILLRKAAEEFIPQSILNRKDKLGYATPNNKWITQLKDQLKPYFDQDFSGILNKDLLMKNYDSFFHVAGKPENGRTFKFIAFAVWKKVNGL
ncbi:MAG: asparagine synthase (glutamine-hydrolyzing) [Bacteroidia bacterium]